MDPRRLPALLHRLFRRHGLLPLQPKARLPQRALLGLRPLLWNRSLSGHESGSPASLRLSLHGPLPVSRPSPGRAGSHAYHRTTDISEPSPAVKIAILIDTKNPQTQTAAPQHNTTHACFVVASSRANSWW